MKRTEGLHKSLPNSCSLLLSTFECWSWLDLGSGGKFSKTGPMVLNGAGRTAEEFQGSAQEELSDGEDEEFLVHDCAVSLLSSHVTLRPE